MASLGLYSIYPNYFGHSLQVSKVKDITIHLVVAILTTYLLTIWSNIRHLVHQTISGRENWQGRLSNNAYDTGITERF